MLRRCWQAAERNTLVVSFWGRRHYFWSTKLFVTVGSSFFIYIIFWEGVLVCMCVCVLAAECCDLSSSWQEGAILVFLPGWDNISGLNDLLVAQQMFRSGTQKHQRHCYRGIIWRFVHCVSLECIYLTLVWKPSDKIASVVASAFSCLLAVNMQNVFEPAISVVSCFDRKCWIELKQNNNCLAVPLSCCVLDRFVIIPLHSLMPTVNQTQVRPFLILIIFSSSCLSLNWLRLTDLQPPS